MPYKDPDRQREYQNRWLKDRRLAWIADNGPCIDCGTWDNLQVDHVDAKLKVTHRVWSWREDRRRKELAKCVVRCWPCHNRKTIQYHEKAHGGSNGAVKLTVNQVLEIRASDEHRTVLAVRYDVDESLIRQIRARKVWKYI
jgi:hypothetical protein